MKIRIELDDSLTEEEVIIRCNSISEKVQKMQMALSEIENAILEKYNIIKTKPIKMGVDKDTGLPFTYYTDGLAE